jgi:hypothetical protein
MLPIMDMDILLPLYVGTRECASSRHAPIVDEQQENDNIYISEEVIVTDSVVAPTSYLQV